MILLTVINTLVNYLILVKDSFTALIGSLFQNRIANGSNIPIVSQYDAPLQNIMDLRITDTISASISQSCDVELAKPYTNTISNLNSLSIENTANAEITTGHTKVIIDEITMAVFNSSDSVITNLKLVNIKNMLGQIEVAVNYVTIGTISWIIAIINEFGLYIKEFSNLVSGSIITIRQEEK